MPRASVHVRVSARCPPAGPRRGKLLIATVQYTLCIGLCITYSVTAGQSLKGMVSEECSGEDCQQVGGWHHPDAPRGAGGRVAGCGIGLGHFMLCPAAPLCKAK